MMTEGGPSSLEHPIELLLLVGGWRLPESVAEIRDGSEEPNGAVKRGPVDIQRGEPLKTLSRAALVTQLVPDGEALFVQPSCAGSVAERADDVA